MTCTWRDCAAESVEVLQASDGEVWARLCAAHRDEYEGALRDGNAPKLLKVWALAHGSKEAFATRMMGSK